MNFIHRKYKMKTTVSLKSLTVFTQGIIPSLMERALAWLSSGRKSFPNGLVADYMLSPPTYWQMALLALP